MKTPWFHIVCEMEGGPKPAPTIRDIQRAVCGRFAGVTLNDIISGRRNQEIIMPRHIAMFLARSLTLKSCPTIAKAFTDRDHTTIMYGVKKIARLLKADVGLQTLVASIGAELGCAE
jgi:chromosomal replication initiator protein